MMPLSIQVTFVCPVCRRFAALQGTPERCVAVAEALDWQVLTPDHIGPLPLSCSVPCWERYWLQSEQEPSMKRVVELMLAQAAALRANASSCGLPN